MIATLAIIDSTSAQMAETALDELEVHRSAGTDIVSSYGALPAGA